MEVNLNLEECRRLCQRALDAWGGRSQELNPEEWTQLARMAGAKLPARWLVLLPHLPEFIGNDEFECDMGGQNLEWVCVPDTEFSEPQRWLEFGGSGEGNSFVFDVRSASMPDDARVVYIDHESMEPIREWSGVVEFVVEMLRDSR